MNNVLGLIKGDLQRNKVSVTLPKGKGEESLYLFTIAAKTSKLKDFKATYGKQVNPTRLKLATKILGENETENAYGVFLDDELRMVFAFNRDFAEYSAKTKSVIYKDIDNVLIDRIVVTGKTEVPLPGIPVDFPSRRCRPMLLKYGIFGR